LTKIAQVLGVPVTTLFGADDVQRMQVDHSQSNQSPLKLLTIPGALRLLRAYGQLKDGRMRRSIVDLVGKIGGEGRKP
jgi:hypothetical protein